MSAKHRRHRMYGVLQLVWAVLFFAVIVPFHKPGLALLPGSDRGEQTTASGAVVKPFCPLCVLNKRSGGDPVPDDDDRVPDLPTDSCAICHIKSLVDTPTVPGPVFVGFEFVAMVGLDGEALTHACASPAYAPTRGPPAA